MVKIKVTIDWEYRRNPNIQVKPIRNVRNNNPSPIPIMRDFKGDSI